MRSSFRLFADPHAMLKRNCVSQQLQPVPKFDLRNEKPDRSALARGAVRLEFVPLNHIKPRRHQPREREAHAP
jgi:hypothetical protein